MSSGVPTAVLLSPGPDAVRAAREVGAHTVVVGPDLTAWELRPALAWADEAIETDWREHRRLLAALGRFAGADQVSVFGFGDASALPAARANAALRLPGNPPQAVAALRDPVPLRDRVVPPAERRRDEFPAGPEYGVEAHSYFGTHTVVRVIPEGLEERTCQVRRLVTAALDTAEYRVGPSHLTVIVTARGPRLLTTRPCPASGTGLYGVTVAAVLGLPQPGLPRPVPAAGSHPADGGLSQDSTAANSPAAVVRAGPSPGTG
jgi:hypothetical protein